MASLKEVKIRINSVSSTRKITSAMKLVASSKLHKAQSTIESMRPYQQRLNAILSHFVKGLECDFNSSLTEIREKKKVIIVCISSNSSLCGAFNSNIIKSTVQTIDYLQQSNIEYEVVSIGAKIADKITRLKIKNTTNQSKLLDNTSYSDVASLANSLITRFLNKEVDNVVLIYNHFKSTATQIVTKENFLPLEMSFDNDKDNNLSRLLSDYIVEPSKREILDSLLPKVLCLRLYTAILDSLAAEHAARVVAMQTATDNADQLLHELTLMYNKTRQAAITAELLDIVGATFQ